MPINAAFFDLETRNPDPEWDIKTWDRLSRVPITCAALVSVGDVRIEMVWWAGMSQTNDRHPSHVFAQMEAGELCVTEEMTEAEVEMMLVDLLTLMLFGEHVRKGEKKRISSFFTWNGVNFDFPVIASNIPHRLDDVVLLAKQSYDPCFQFVRSFGYPIGIPSTAEEMMGESKAEGMTGAEAAELWPEQAQRIMRYCYGDVKLTKKVVDAVMAEKQIRWVTKKGKHSAKTIKKWSKVEKVMKLDEPNRNWMSDYQGGLELEDITGWMEARDGQEEV